MDCVRYKVVAPTRPIKTSIDLPESKSILNRLLILGFLHGFKINYDHTYASGDVLLMKRNLDCIKQCVIDRIPMVVPVNNAGTVSRFLIAVLSNLTGKYLVTGSKRMNSRPVKSLIDSLKQLGADIQYQGTVGFLPVLINGANLIGRKAKLDSNESSQFLTALLLLGSSLDNGLSIDVSNRSLFNNPYVQMTLRLLERLGAGYEIHSNSVRIEKTESISESPESEKDWSSASFWYQIVALSENSEVLLKELKWDSLQGDRALINIFKFFGVESVHVNQGVLIRNSGKYAGSFSYDFSFCPDLALPVIITAAVLGIKGYYTGLASLEYKESTRLSFLINILKKTGAGFTTDKKSYLEIRTAMKTELKNSESNEDHRIVMSLAPMALKQKSIILSGVLANRKSYPNYWSDLQSADFSLVSQ